MRVMGVSGVGISAGVKGVGVLGVVEIRVGTVVRVNEEEVEVVGEVSGVGTRIRAGSRARGVGSVGAVGLGLMMFRSVALFIEKTQNKGLS